MDEIKESIRKFLEKNIKAENLSDGDDLFASGYVNSLFALQLITFIEKEFKLKIKNKDISEDNFRSINRIADTVMRIKG